MKENLEEIAECKGDSLKEKIKEKWGIIGMIGLETLGFIHSLSHIIQVRGAFGLSQIERNEKVISFLGCNIAPILTNPAM